MTQPADRRLLTEAAGNATYARGAVLPPSPMVDVEILPLVQDVYVIDRVDGETWGYASGRLLTTPDHGYTWVDRCAAPINNTIRGMIMTPDGEVVAYDQRRLYKSTGWGAPELSWTEKIVTNGTAQFNTFSIAGSSDGQKLIIAEYGPGGTQAWIDSRYAHISTDGGDTWHTRWDSDAITGNTPDGSHVHAAGYDEITDRFYVSEGHSVGAGIWHSTDDGLTWARAEGMRCDDPTINTGMDAGPTMIIATPDGLSVGSDDVIGGMYGVPRTADPMDAQLRYLWAWRPTRTGTNGFARNGMLDPETGMAVMCTSTSGPAPIIMAGNAHTAGLVWEWPDWAGNNTDNINAVIIEPGGWVIGYGSESGVQKSILGRLPAPSVNIPPDRGGVLSGVAQDPTSVAIGASARAIESQRAVVIGSESSASNEDVIIGALIDGGSTTGGGKIIVGAYASSAQATVTIGRYASSLGQAAVLIGNGATASAAAEQTVIGASATGAASRVTVVGRGGNASGASSSAFGNASSATGARSTVVGQGATAAHTDAVALGQATATTGTSQVHIGPRHMMMLETTAPTTSAVTGGGGLWVQGGKLWFRSATQTAVEVQLKGVA